MTWTLEDYEQKLNSLQREIDWTRTEIEKLKKPAPCPLEEGKEVELGAVGGDYVRCFKEWANQSCYSPARGTTIQLVDDGCNDTLIIRRKYSGVSSGKDDARRLLAAFKKSD